MNYPRRSAFTLIELLVVIAIIAILAIVVVLTLNPAQLLAQSRDSNRLSDLSTLSDAMNVYNTDQSGASTYSLGITSTTYFSISDPSATSSAGSNCATMGLPVTSTGWTDHCPASSTLRSVVGTGWIPVNFSNISAGAPFSVLSVDPVNTTSSLFYYTYMTNGSTYELTAPLESQKYLKQELIVPDIDSARLAVGSNLSLLPLEEGLVGYWPLNEGSGSSTIDQSGNGNNGTWSGPPGGTSGYYSAGKVGPYAGYFNGSNDYVNVGSLGSFPAQGTISFWMTTSALASYPNALSTYYNGVNGSIRFEQAGSNFYSYDGTNQNYFTTGLVANTWYFITFTWNVSTNNETTYFNGNKISSSGGNFPASIPDFAIGEGFSTSRYWNGLIDDVRVYNRALSAAEIQALYNAEK